MPIATANTLLRNVVPPDRLKLIKPNHEPDGERIKSFLSLRNEDVAAAAGIPAPSVRFDERMPSALRERMILWAVAINLVGNFFGNEQQTVLWFQTPNPLLGSISPKEMIRRGRFRKLLYFIQTALEENKPN